MAATTDSPFKLPWSYLSDCPVIIAKQACSHVTLNIHSQFSVLCLFFCFFVLFFVLFWLFLFLFLFVLSWSFRFRLFVLLLLRTEELEVSPCPLTNVILIEKIAQILTIIGLALGIKTIIITLDTKLERKGKKKNQMMSKNFQRYELVKG